MSPGAMKTYWLEGCEFRPALTKIISSQIEPISQLEWERAADVRDSIAEHSAQLFNNKEFFLTNATNSEPNSYVNGAANPVTFQTSPPAVKPTPTVTSPVEERRMYSPVTFQDVARRSIANSPNRTDKDKGMKPGYLISYCLGDCAPGTKSSVVFGATKLYNYLAVKIKLSCYNLLPEKNVQHAGTSPAPPALSLKLSFQISSATITHIQQLLQTRPFCPNTGAFSEDVDFTMRA